MSTQLISSFRNATDNTVQMLLSNAVRQKDVDVICVWKYSRTTVDMPVYAFITPDELVLVLIDWREQPYQEVLRGDITLAMPFLPENRVNPVSRLSEFMSQYMKAMQAADIRLKKVWGVLVSNSYFSNDRDLAEEWEKKHITVIHNVQTAESPLVNWNNERNALTDSIHSALFNWFDEREDLKFPTYGEYGEEEHSEDIKDMEKHFYREGYTAKEAAADDKAAEEKEREKKKKEREEYDRLIQQFISDHAGIDVDDDDVDISDDDDVDDDIPELPETSGPKYRRPVSVEILPPISDPHEQLDNMVGCDNIKKQFYDLLALTRYNCEMRHRYPAWTQHQVSLHAVFLGRPGTGKTTLCKIYGALLKEARMLTKGHVVVCGRSTFVGSSWGDEEEAVNQVLELAEGGVLMIDEAYLLNSPHPNDPGKHVLPLFMERLADESRRNIAVILCGYKEPMEGLLNLNPGLDSRFPHRFEFEDFSIDQLMEITRRRLAVYNYRFTRAGQKKYRMILEKAYKDRNPEKWGNARFVANLLESIYLRHAKRCMKHKADPSRKFSNVFSITSSDIQPIEVPKEKRRIGF